MSNKHVILIGAGEMGSQKPVIEDDDYVIALDGGLLFCAEQDIVPNMIVGDFDSLAEDKQMLLKQYPQEIIYKLPCEKDDTDTLAAIKLAIKKGFTSFSIYGGLGGRLSHTMANLQTLMYLKEQGLHGELIGDKCRIFMIKDESIILQPHMFEDVKRHTTLTSKQQNSGYVSIFSYSENSKGVTLKNLKYEVEDAELTNSFPLGVSNEFVGRQVEISVKKGTLLIIIES